MKKNRVNVGKNFSNRSNLNCWILGINPPGFVAQVVAFAFGLAAAAFFLQLSLGI